MLDSEAIEEALSGALPAGAVIGGKYRIEKVIGRGAQGVVHLATTTDGQQVALKALHRHLTHDPMVRKRFHREAAILKRLEGENVVRLHDLLEEDELLVIVLDYIEGASLEALLQRAKPLDTMQAIEIALQVCAALGCAHAANVVHRDLKPANVLLEGHSIDSAPDSTELRVRVVDFGLARVVQGEASNTSFTETNMIFGTPEYMAPEQARGDENVDGRADLYAAGVILYEMVVGNVPFAERTPLATITAHLTQAVPPPRSGRSDGSVSAALEAVILRALGKEADDRYATAREMASALAAVRDTLAVVKSGKDGVVIATSDTDLDMLGAAQLASMKTLPADMDSSMSAELRAKLDEQIEQERAARAKAGPTVAPATKPSVGITPSAPKRVARPEPRELSTSRWVWALVAVVFAAVGVAIGAAIGTR
jgi:serine/threonine-protein kinase